MRSDVCRVCMLFMPVLIVINVVNCLLMKSLKQFEYANVNISSFNLNVFSK